MSSHAVKAKAFLKNEARASWHDRALYAVREKRDRQAYSLPEWEELRNAASAIKEHTLSHLADYLEEFERKATANGIKVHWAESGEEMNEIVAKIKTFPTISGPSSSQQVFLTKETNSLFEIPL